MYRNHGILLHQSTRISIRQIMENDIHNVIALSQESPVAPDTSVKRVNYSQQYLPSLDT